MPGRAKALFQRAEQIACRQIVVLPRQDERRIAREAGRCGDHIVRQTIVGPRRRMFVGIVEAGAEQGRRRQVEFGDAIESDTAEIAVVVKVLSVDAGHYGAAAQARSEERRVGKECVSKCRSRWWPLNSKKKIKK